MWNRPRYRRILSWFEMLIEMNVRKLQFSPVGLNSSHADYDRDKYNAVIFTE